MGAHAVCFNQSKGKGRGEKQNTNSRELSLASLKRPPTAAPPLTCLLQGCPPPWSTHEARHLSTILLSLDNINVCSSVVSFGLWRFAFQLTSVFCLYSARWTFDLAMAVAVVVRSVVLCSVSVRAGRWQHFVVV